MLKTSLGKIEQLGSGAAYCQLMDVLYPGKIPLGKINWRAKFDYEFVANFKILQQTFTKLGVMKHLEVEKLVKCKYQDNLELLQWFKKIFDNTGVSGRDYNAPLRRGDNDTHPRREREKEKENRSVSLASNSKTALELTERSLVGCGSFQNSDRDEDQLRLPASRATNANNSGLDLPPLLDSSWREDLRERALSDEREFYLRKFKEIEHLMEEWDCERSSRELIDRVRRIILVPAGVQWTIDQGELVEEQSESFLPVREEGVDN